MIIRYESSLRLEHRLISFLLKKCIVYELYLLSRYMYNIHWYYEKFENIPKEPAQKLHILEKEIKYTYQK